MTHAHAVALYFATAPALCVTLLYLMWAPHLRKPAPAPKHADKPTHRR